MGAISLLRHILEVLLARSAESCTVEVSGGCLAVVGHTLKAIEAYIVECRF